MAPSKSTKSPAFQWYPRDFLSSSKVQRMSAAERGAYIMLLSICWLDGSLPNDIPTLARLAGIKERQFARSWESGPLGECFTVKNGRLYNERLDRERKVQADFRKKQKENADKGWQSRRNATALPGSHQSGNAPLPQSSSAILNPQSAQTDGPRARAPLHDTSHKHHAACGRVCVHASLHDDFVRRRNHSNADKELREWYLAVDSEWSIGVHANDEPGDPFDFWRARYAEHWPAMVAAKQTSLDRWAAKHGVVR